MNPKFYIGVLLLLVSYLQLLFPKSSLHAGSLTLFNAAFMLGIILISEGITLRLIGRSLISEIRKSKNNLISFIAVSIIGGVLTDGVFKWLGKLWIYPYWDFQTYLLIFIPGFAVYWLMIIESYLATKAIADVLHKGKKRVAAYFRFEPILYKTLGVSGVLLVLLSIGLIFGDYIAAQRTALITPQDLNMQTVNYKFNFFYGLPLFLDLWFIFEFIEYARKKTSLLKDIIHHYPVPLASIFIGSILVAILMESQNAFHGFWVYTNIPFEKFHFFGISPLVLLGWPIHYIAFLSLFRAFTGKQSDEIWRGDRIP